VYVSETLTLVSRVLCEKICPIPSLIYATAKIWLNADSNTDRHNGAANLLAFIVALVYLCAAKGSTLPQCHLESPLEI